MKIKQFSYGFIACLVLLYSGNGFAEEKIMVNKAEYEELKKGHEKLKAAVEFFMSEREANQQAVQEAKQTAEEAVASAH